MAGRTTLIVSHRLSLAHAADLVVVVEDGRIVEQGAPGELLVQDESRFAAMVRAEAQLHAEEHRAKNVEQNQRRNKHIPEPERAEWESGRVGAS
jgi:ABC-type glutathione transport system ATPase component